MEEHGTQEIGKKEKEVIDLLDLKNILTIEGNGREVFVLFDIFNDTIIATDKSATQDFLEINIVHMNKVMEMVTILPISPHWNPWMLSRIITFFVSLISERGYNVHYTHSGATPLLLKIVDNLVPDFKTATSIKYKIRDIEMEHTFNYYEMLDLCPVWFSKHWKKKIHIKAHKMRINNPGISPKPYPICLTMFTDKELAVFYRTLIVSLHFCLDNKNCTLARKNYMKSAWDPARPIMENYDIIKFIKKRKNSNN